VNYNSVDEIFAAGITNMQVLRNNTIQDDGIDIITGVDWFTFKGVVASKIYASGNSFIGFGSSAEHLKVNRRDGAMRSLYREEGTLYNYYKFLKIRWVGYSAYNHTTTAYALTYDVILWDTGDISLHMISLPTSNNAGTYSLVASSTYSYTVSTASPDVTFKKTDSGFTVNNSIIELLPPFETRYLVRSGSTYYTVVDNALSEISVSSLTSDVFLTLGVKEIPSTTLLLSLSNPELLYWTDDERGKLNTGFVVHGTPSLPQIVRYEEKTIPENTVISKAEVYNANLAIFTVTFDSGSSWLYYNPETSSWVVATSNNEGMDATAIKNLTAEQWATAPLVSTYQFRCGLTSRESRAGSVYINTVPIV
jgi:hypothetical protein